MVREGADETQSLEIDREQRTRAFNTVGILKCGQILESINVPNPSDQMKVVYAFLSRDDGIAGGRNRPYQWVEAGDQARPAKDQSAAAVAPPPAHSEIPSRPTAELCERLSAKPAVHDRSP